jgi:hypothetical protein
MLNYFTDLYINRHFGTNFIVSNVLFVLGVVLLFNDYKFNKKGILIKLGDAIVTFVIQTFFSSIFYFFWGPEFMGYIIWPIVIFSHAFLMNDMKWFDRVMKALTLSSLYILVIPLSAAIGAALNIKDEDIYFVVLLTSLSFILLKMFSLEEVSKISYPCLITQVVLTVLVIILNVMISMGGMEAMTFSLRIMVLLILFLISCFTYYMFYMVSSEHEKAIRIQAMAFKSHNDSQMVKLTQDNIEDLRKMRHDMRNQYQYMKILLANKDYEKLNSFFSDMTESSFVPLNFIDCGNNAISGIMNMEIHKAKEADLSIEHTILVPKEMTISDFDLCRFLTNIIDNAIEGTERDGIKNASISVSITYHDPYLLVMVKNPVSDKIPPEKRLTMATSKGDTSINGYGKKIINEIVTSYNGEIKTEIQDGQYIVSAMLETAEKESKTEKKEEEPKSVLVSSPSVKKESSGLKEDA